MQGNVGRGAARLLAAAEGKVVQVGRVRAPVVRVAILGRPGSLASFARAARASLVVVHELALLLRGHRMRRRIVGEDTRGGVHNQGNFLRRR